MGYCWGGVSGGTEVPSPGDNKSGGGAQQQHISGNGARGGISGDGNGNNGENSLVNDGYDGGHDTGGGGPLPNGVLEEQQDGGIFAMGDSLPLAGTLGHRSIISADDGIFYPTLGPGLHVLAGPPPSLPQPALPPCLRVVSMGPSGGLVTAVFLCMEPGA